MLKNSKKGFTLVEIMIVVAIIGILVGIAVPGFIRARVQAQGKACSENLQKIDGSKQQWALETNQAATASPDWAALISATNGFLKKTPLCPGSGTYVIGTVAADPTCTYTPQGNGLHVLP